MKICWNTATRIGCRRENRDGANYCLFCGRPLAGAMRLLNLGDVLKGTYEIKRVVGVGGSGAVYLISDWSASGADRALKELSDSTQREQFALEADILRPLSHPNLPRAHEYFREGDRDYMIMEYVPGRSLGEVLKERQDAGLPPLDESVVAGYAIQICRALEFLHSRQPHPVIHRDIKPDNIRITPHGELKLVDFGLVKQLDHANPATKRLAQGLTPNYASPEQWGLLPDRHTDPRSDVYSLGATLYHLLTGQAPKSALDRTPGMGRPNAPAPASPQPADDTLVRPRKLNLAITERVERALLTAMALQPEQRYPGAREFRAALSVGSGTLRMVKR